jgi:hypothetical protein
VDKDWKTVMDDWKTGRPEDLLEEAVCNTKSLEGLILFV